jgi:hypothetical protein
MKNISFLSCALLLFTSCASGEMKYTPPETHTIINEVVLSKSFNDVWDKLVGALSNDGFTIDSISKDSGLIVASKKLDPPTYYADCGSWRGYFKNMRGSNSYYFQGADSANFTSMSGSLVVKTSKTSNLTSRSNIFLKKVDSKKTSIQVNSTYKLTMDILSSAYIYPQGDTYLKDTGVIDWNTKEEGKIEKGETKCLSNGNLEKRIIEFIE